VLGTGGERKVNYMRLRGFTGRGRGRFDLRAFTIQFRTGVRNNIITARASGDMKETERGIVYFNSGEGVRKGGQMRTFGHESGFAGDNHTTILGGHIIGNGIENTGEFNEVPTIIVGTEVGQIEEAIISGCKLQETISDTGVVNTHVKESSLHGGGGGGGGQRGLDTIASILKGLNGFSEEGFADSVIEVKRGSERTARGRATDFVLLFGNSVVSIEVEN